MFASKSLFIVIVCLSLGACSYEMKMSDDVYNGIYMQKSDYQPQCQNNNPDYDLMHEVQIKIGCATENNLNVMLGKKGIDTVNNSHLQNRHHFVEKYIPKGSHSYHK